MDLPRRPRLADHALARRHTARGETFVAVHDARDGSVYTMGTAAWEQVSRADGTRDLAELADARLVLESLAPHGLLADGEGDAKAPEGVDGAAAKVDAARPLEGLPGHTLVCDGRGGCCRQYASIEFHPDEAARARALVPGIEGGFLPLFGSRPGGSLAVALVRGRCAYLEDDGRCAIHAAGGAAAKPRGCRAYPRTYVDDGESVRVSLGIECACALLEEDAGEGEPLVLGSTWADVPLGTRARVLPEVVPITAATGARRAGVAAWSRRVLEVGFGKDAAAAFLGLSEVLARGQGETDVDAAPPPASAVAGGVASIAARASGAAAAADGWRSAEDAARLARHEVSRAASAWLESPAWLAPRAPSSERLYARASIFGHHLAGEVPLVDALRERAARLMVARAMGTPHAIATVEHVLRGQR